MSPDPFRRPPMIDFDHPAGKSLFWRISDAMDRLVEQLENYSPADLLIQKIDRDIAAAEQAQASPEPETPMPADKQHVKVGDAEGGDVCACGWWGPSMDEHREVLAEQSAESDEPLRSAAWWRANEPTYDGSNDEFLAWLNNGKPATDEQKRHFAYRNAGYNGWLGPDSRPVDDTEQSRLNASFGWQRLGDPGDDAGGGLDMPPAAEPYTPPKRTPPSRPTAAPTSTTSAGGVMSSIEEVRAGIAVANESANEGLGALQQAHASLEQSQGLLMQTTEGSGQADVSEANELLAQAVANVEELQQQVSAAISAAEEVANRL